MESNLEKKGEGGELVSALNAISSKVPVNQQPLELHGNAAILRLKNRPSIGFLTLFELRHTSEICTPVVSRLTACRAGTNRHCIA
jgi:hypothetical protein